MTKFWVLLPSVLVLAACGGQSGSYDQADREQMQVLMSDTIDPLAWVVWDSAGYLINEDGEHNLAPTTDEGWEEVRLAALELAESSELMMAPGLAVDSESWGVYVRGLTAQAEVAAQAAAAHDDDWLFDAGGAIYNVCSGCHQQFSPQVEGL